MSKVWKTVGFDEQAAGRLAATLDLPLPLAGVLVSRGQASPEQARRFLNPRIEDLFDPYDWSDMNPAVERILRAVKTHERIVVFGDYDADGVTATALLLRLLRRLGAEVHPFLPLRLEEGYGLGPDALRRCLDTLHPALVITVDCGTGAVAAVRTAAQAGVEIVVTDHHDSAGEIAPALAVINPKLESREETQNLSGVGVAFKLAWALAERAGLDRQEVFRYLDLVATGTIADVVPLTGENRILVRHGLEQLNRKPLTGLQALAEVGGIDREIEEYHLGFVLGPRLNAAGRLDDAQVALDLLMTDDPAGARSLAKQLDRSNRERQAIEATILEEAIREIEADYDEKRDLGLVLASPRWHAGVIGIVASRIASRYRRPTILIAVEESGVGRGSGRSIEGFNLVEHLAACRNHLIRFGGHAMAAGLEIEAPSLPAFRAAFNQRVAVTLGPDQLRPVQNIDAWIELADADARLYQGLKHLRPFGFGNPRPVWAARRVRVLGQPRILKEKHLKMLVAAGGAQRQAIGFGLADQPLPEGPLDLAFTLELNTWMDRETLQLNVQDLRAGAG